MPCGLLSSGSHVTFRLRDVLVPDFRRILEEVTPELELAGEIMFLSDNGMEGGQFAIVGLGGTMSPLIVPIDRLCGIAQANRRADTMSRTETLRRYRA